MAAKQQERQYSWLWTSAAICILALMGWYEWSSSLTRKQHSTTAPACSVSQTDPGTLSAESNRGFQASNHIALANLLCASGLPGSAVAHNQELARVLDEWAARVKSETQRHLYRFISNPSEYDHSEGYFRMLMMAVVLYEDFGVRYNPQLVSAPSNSTVDFNFFQNPKDVFIEGLLGSERTVTCSSMPVLYIAIGRRLGYPLKLVTTKAHLFVRWKGNGERFSVEATGKGMNRYDDEH